MAAKLIFVNVPSADLDQGKRFYDVLFQTDNFFQALTDQYRALQQPISNDGIDLVLAEPFQDMETVTPYYAVDDLDRTLGELRSAGGEVLADPFPLQVPQAVAEDPDYRDRFRRNDPRGNPDQPAGRCAIVRDPNGNIVGVAELDAPAEQHFRGGRHRRSVDRDQEEDAMVAKRLRHHLPR